MRIKYLLKSSSIIFLISVLICEGKTANAILKKDNVPESLKFLLIPPSSNADLSKFVIQLGSDISTYSPVGPSYAMNVSNVISSTIITPTSADAGASITINGQPVSSGTASGSIPLHVGNNAINIIVLAQDGITSKKYIINVNRGGGTAVINSFSPASGGPGTMVTIIGENLYDATDVFFGGTRANSFIIHSATQINAVVAHGTTGNIQINTSSAGIAITSGFTYLSPLPVNFVSLKSNSTISGIELQWQVEDVADSKQFIVERSKNGIDFIEIGSLVSDNKNIINWNDINPTPGENYYRIKAISLSSNNMVYSSTVKSTYSQISGKISVYPNPIRGTSFNMHSTGMKNGVYVLAILNSNGTVVYKRLLEIEGGTKNIKIDLPETFVAGIYYIKCIDHNQTSRIEQLMITK